MLLLLSSFPQNTSYPTKRTIWKNLHQKILILHRLSRFQHLCLHRRLPGDPNHHNIIILLINSQQTSASIKDSSHHNSHPKSSWGLKSSQSVVVNRNSQETSASLPFFSYQIFAGIEIIRVLCYSSKFTEDVCFIKRKCSRK